MTLVQWSTCLIFPFHQQWSHLMELAALFMLLLVLTSFPIASLGLVISAFFD